MQLRGNPNPHFSPSFCCGGGSGHVYVALPRASRHTVKYACGALRRARLAKRRIHARLHRLATKHGKKCGLTTVEAYPINDDDIQIIDLIKFNLLNILTSYGPSVFM